MTRNAAALPWRQATQLRDDLRTGELSRAQKWLELASRGELNQPCDPYELP